VLLLVRAPEFEVDVQRPSVGVVVVVVHGEIDAYTAPRLKKALLEAIDCSPAKFVVDLSGVSFIDPAGLGVLVIAQNTLRAIAVPLELVIREHIRRIFEVTSLDTTFVLHSSRESALKR
jgi:anti-sigma B factor antagonist